MKIIIIGNGILALSTAFRLLKQGDSELVIIGPRARTGGATPAAAAMLNSFAELEHGSLESKESLEYFGMSHLAAQMWPSFERELIEYAGDLLPVECASCQILTGGCFGRGTYVINNSTTNHLEDLNYNAVIAGLKEFNESFFEVEPDSIPNYFPEARSRAQRALLIPNEGWLNPKIVLNKLENILYSNPKVKYIDDVVTVLNFNGIDMVESVTVSSGVKIVGENVLLANGVGVTGLIENTPYANLIPPVFSSVGVSIEIRSINEKHSNVIRSPNRGGGCGIYTAPYFKGPNWPRNHILIGASSVTTLNPRFYGRIVSVSHLLHSAIKEVNQEFYNAELIGVNVGNRPIALDGYPLLGRVDGSNLFIITGTKRDGFHLAPLISEFIAKQIISPNSVNPYTLFRPDRDVIKDIPIEKAENSFVASKINEAYQHGFVATNHFQVQQLEADWLSKIRFVHSEIGATTFGVPTQMYSVYRDILGDPVTNRNLLEYVKNQY
ncbi:FAD-dependent oxidoreductase [Propionivibrio sp.]|uniref:FAD-dependent oxidoreductase n=1 Tax=Propionivibrio sp. TaxID=2212460 RepID=UPI003BF28F1D